LDLDATMSRLAIVRESDGRVVTFVRSDAPTGWLPPDGCVASPEESLPVGWQMAEAVDPVPASVSPYQFRVWLIRSGVSLAQVDAMIDALPQPARDEARVAWEYGLEVRRGHPLIGQFGAALGMDAAAIDQAFREAATL
jgi:hypothetical protein